MHILSDWPISPSWSATNAGMGCGPVRLKAIYSGPTSTSHPRSGSSWERRFATGPISPWIPSSWTSPPSEPRLFPSWSVRWMAGSANSHPSPVDISVAVSTVYGTTGLSTTVEAGRPAKANPPGAPYRLSSSNKNRHVDPFRASGYSHGRPGPSISLLSMTTRTPTPFPPRPDPRCGKRPIDGLPSTRSKPPSRSSQAISTRLTRGSVERAGCRIYIHFPAPSC